METTMTTLNASLRRVPLIASAIFGALAMISGALATADESNAAARAVVQYGDLELSNSQGAGALYDRIAAAAGEVCQAYADDGHNLTVHFRVRACVHKAIADAVIEVGSPELLAIYGAKTGLPIPRRVAAVQAR
jgi:UrcA family protein